MGRAAALLGLAVVLIVLLIEPRAAADAPATNLFSGNWQTMFEGSDGTGSVQFQVVSSQDGPALIRSLGGTPCPAGATFYRGDYSDPSNPHGVIGACATAPDHIVGRFESDSDASHTPGDIDLLITAAGHFQGTFTYMGTQYGYSGTFQSHFIGDGCCPSSGTTGSTSGSTTGSTTGNTTGSTGNTTGGSQGGGINEGDCAADAASYSPRVTVIKSGKPAFCHAINSRQKETAREWFNDALLLYAGRCDGSLDPGQIQFTLATTDPYCGAVIVALAALWQINHDPPSRSYDLVAVAKIPPAIVPVGIECPSGCPELPPALADFAQKQALYTAALSGLATAGNRYTGASRAHSRPGQLLQSGVAAAYSGEVASALAAFNAAGSTLASDFAARGLTEFRSSSDLAAMSAQAQHGLDPATAAYVAAHGISAAGFATALMTALAGAGSSITFAQALALPQDPAPFHVGQHRIRLAQVSAIVAALRAQRAISRGAASRLGSDLRSLSSAKTSSLRARRLATLVRDIGARTRGTVATLLQSAAGGLGPV